VDRNFPKLLANDAINKAPVLSFLPSIFLLQAQIEMVKKKQCGSNDSHIGYLQVLLAALRVQING
jgi:hypothetical protein